MISEESCDLEDWSNDAENSALSQDFLSIDFKIYSNRKLLYKIFVLFTILLFFNVLIKNSYQLHAFEW